MQVTDRAYGKNGLNLPAWKCYKLAQFHFCGLYFSARNLDTKSSLRGAFWLLGLGESGAHGGQWAFLFL